MSYDDIIYTALLFASIAFGQFYQKIGHKKIKKLVGSVAGLIIIYAVSGVHIIHPLVTCFINSVIILCLNKRHCHLVSFAFSFLYLLFFRTSLYFGVPYAPPHTNLVQMMLTLKMVGLAFEVNSAYCTKRQFNMVDKTSEEKLEDEMNDIRPNFRDIFHYTFNYVGVLTGPYYKYKTFRDSFDLPFANPTLCRQETFKKLTYMPIHTFFFVLVTYLWPLSYTLTEEFDTERSWLYRLWYVYPSFFIFKMRIYIGLGLSECVCTMAGLGVYPTFTEPKSGQGPSKNFQRMKELASDVEKLKEETYDFETIHNINPYGVDLSMTVRECMRNWNITIQYWLGVNIHKRFPYKKFRTLVTMLISAFWHGVYTGYYVCIGSVPFWLQVENVYVKLYIKNNSGTSLKVWHWIIWFFKTFAISYLSMAFHLLTFERVIHYYTSVYHVGVIMGAVFYIVGLLLMKVRDEKNAKTD